jgi:hypothetical protein
MSKGKWDSAKESAVVFLALGLIVTVVVGTCSVPYWTKSRIIATVEKTERVNSSSGENSKSYYLVFTDQETLKNTDTLFYLKFNSSDLYGQIKDGETYEFTVYGFRIPFFSMYRNIVDFEEVD